MTILESNTAFAGLFQSYSNPRASTDARSSWEFLANFLWNLFLNKTGQINIEEMGNRVFAPVGINFREMFREAKAVGDKILQNTPISTLSADEESRLKTHFENADPLRAIMKILMEPENPNAPVEAFHVATGHMGRPDFEAFSKRIGLVDIAANLQSRQNPSVPFEQHQQLASLAMGTILPWLFPDPAVSMTDKPQPSQISKPP